ncbi:MAG: formyltransferase family protein [Nanoarchaeota archaeon]|nr:formyltransferase family protein [Nanoarchaeota archaeon]
MNIIYCGYRKWAFDILKKISNSSNKWKISLVVTTKEKETDYKINDVETTEINPNKIGDKTILDKFKSKKPSYILFYGWSWFVPKSVLEIAPCICLHPSPLPKYRGGSPLQHQIINGEKKSAVTLFFMTERLDDGDILSQESFLLNGDLNDILIRIADIGAESTIKVLDRLQKGEKFAKPQDNTAATLYKRRTPEQSEIKLEDFKTKTAQQLHDFVRALQDPYPNAFVVCKNGTRLYILKTKVSDKSVE